MAEDERTAAEVGGFLPPEPPGPEPELGGPAAQPPPPPASLPPPPPQAWQQPPPPQAWQQPPPGWQPPPQQWPQQQTWHQPVPPAPGNGQAVAGFVLSVVAAALLVMSFGFSSIVSLACAGLGIVFSRKGRQNVEEGRTPKHADLARAGVIVGIVTLVLTILATAAWIAVFAATGG